MIVTCSIGVAGIVGVASADEPRSPPRVARRIHSRGRYPNDLLVAPPPGTSNGTPGARRPLPVFGDRSAPTPTPAPEQESESWTPNFQAPAWMQALFNALGFVGRVLLVIAIIAAVAFIVWLLYKFRRPVREVPDAEKKLRAAPEDASTSVDPLLAMPELPHEELARLGRFREAVHALLVGALHATGWTPEGRGRGLTAREIVGAYGKPTPPREPLVELLGLVERVWFGGRDATRETYDVALAAYHRFVPVESRTLAGQAGAS